MALMLAQPSMIKRPVLTQGDKLIIGFDPARYSAALKA
jgi:arsenate reductase